MKNSLTLLSLLILLIAGCGQRGPLYLAEPAATPSEAAESAQETDKQ